MTLQPALSVKPKPDLVSKAMLATAVLWVLMQWWWASPLPYLFGNFIPVLHLDEQKFWHLAFAFFLSTLAIAHAGKPNFKTLSGLISVMVAFCATIPCVYLVWESQALVDRAGDPSQLDTLIGVFGLSLLLFFCYIELSLGLVLVAGTAIAYLLWGDHSILPEIMQWKSASVSKTVSHLWLYTEGVFGISIGVATQFIFLFVLFGEILQRMGFGVFITKLALYLFSGQKSGSAKAAVMSSAVVGSISGSSTANVVTTGNFTIPLMVRSGMSKEKAGAVEVAASSNGQLMPPIMGAAAFLLAEYTATPYQELIYHALLPAVSAFFGLMCIVHFDTSPSTRAAKSNSSHHSPRERVEEIREQHRLLRIAGGIVLTIVAGAALYILRQNVSTEAFFFIFGIGVVSLYIYSMYRNGKINMSADHLSLTQLLRSGAHFAFPVVVLLWLIVAEGLSPFQSIWWSVMVAFLVLWTRPGLRRMFNRKDSEELIDFVRAIEIGEIAREFVDICLITVKRMLPISLATAFAGIVVGAISLSGLQQILGQLVIIMAGDSFFLLLLMLAIACLILGLGLPTTPNYILISSLFAGALIGASEQFGLSVPIVAIHLFILYFGVMADDTPPVGLCAYAASAISGGRPIRTGLLAFLFDIRTAILPFAFIFNPYLLMIDTNWIDAIAMWVASLTAMFCLASALQSQLIIRNHFFESLMLFCACLVLLCPQWINDTIHPKWQSQARHTLYLPASQPDRRLRLEFTNPERNIDKVMSINTVAGEKAIDTIYTELGVEINTQGTVTEVELFSTADELELEPGWELLIVGSQDDDRPDPRWFWLLALGIITIVIVNQNKRRRSLELA